MNLDDRLTRASNDLRMVVAGRDPKPITAVARHHNMMRFVVASTAIVTTTAAVGFIAVGTSKTPALPPASQPALETSTTTSNPTTTTTQQPPSSSGKATALDLSHLDVSAAVAPFDHESNVESLLLETGIESVWSERLDYISECMAAAGFDGPQPVVLPSRDDPFLISNRQFPKTDLLAAEGFVFLPGVPASPNDFEANQERDDAAVACSTNEESWHLDSDRTRASELFGSLRSAWEEVLIDVDSSVEIQTVLGGFSSCLVDAGIPNQYTDSLDGYLGYMDSLLAEVVDDFTQSVQINEEFGKLYAECGRELFQMREELRSGDRRVSFLNDHAEEIHELSDLIGASG